MMFLTVRAPARNGWHYDSDQKRVTQVMNLQNGQHKGAKTILQERGIDVEGKLNQCKCCKQERSRGFTGEVRLLPTENSRQPTRFLGAEVLATGVS